MSNPRLGPADSNLTQGIQHMEYKTAISSGTMGMTQPNTGSLISPSLQPIVIGNKSKMNYKIVYSVLFVLAASASALNWSICGDTTDPIKVTALSGQFNSSRYMVMAGKFKVAYDMDAPIEAEVILSKKFIFGWTRIPCVDELGSCNYTDICQMTPFNNSNCPEPFTDNDLPCSCPVPQGQYTFKDLGVNLNLIPSWLENGRYRAQITLKQNGKRLICLLVDTFLSKVLNKQP